MTQSGEAERTTGKLPDESVSATTGTAAKTVTATEEVSGKDDEGSN